MTSPVLDIRGLTVDLRSRQGTLRVLDDVSLSVGSGEAVALVGESGCGKSMTALSVMRLISAATLERTAGEILLEGTDLLGLDEAAMQDIRGDRIGIVFQDPMTFLNPVMTIGQQLGNPLRRHRNMRGTALRRRVHELLDLVRIPEPAQIARKYPHELSGGMRQRVLIAIALSCEPKLLIADEPTTALDVTIQAQVLEVMQDSVETLGSSLLMITHNMGIVAGMCDRACVMYAGRVVETAGVDALFATPRHPYTQGLLNSVLRHDRAPGSYQVMGGSVPNLFDPPEGCRFRPRCALAGQDCLTQPPLEDRGATQRAACWRDLA